MANNNYQDLTPDEQQRLNEAQKQHEENIKATTALEATIKQLAKNNAKGSSDKTQFSDNLLNIKKYSASVQDQLSNETSKLFDQLTELNDNSRKGTKSEIRDNLKQLEVLRELSKNVQNEDQRLELQKYIDTTEKAINANSNRFTAFVSKVGDNFGDIGAILSGLNDSPLLSMGFAYFGNKIKGALSENRAQNYAVQEGSEEQLLELLQQREKSAKKQEAILKEIADRQSESKNDTTQSTNNEPIIIDDESLSKIKNKELEKSLLDSNNELSSIDNKLDELKSINSSINAQSSEPVVENVVNNNLTIPELDLDLSSFNLSSLQELLEEANYELIAIQDKLSTFLDYSLNDKNDSQEPVQVSLNDDDTFNKIESQLYDINNKLSPLLNGLEERRREDEIYNDQLLSAIQDLSSKAGGTSTTSKDGEGIFGSFFMMLNPKKLLGGLLKGFKKGFGGLGKMIGKTIPRLLSRLALPALIVGALFSGVTEAIDRYKETGSVREAVEGYFSGILEFITFGFFGQNELDKVKESIKNFSEPLYNALSYPFEKIVETVENIMSGDYKEALKTYFELNPLVMIGKGIGKVFEYVTESFNRVVGDTMKDLNNTFNEFKSNFKIPSLDLPDFSFFGDDDEKQDSSSIKINDTTPIQNSRDNLRKEINSVYVLDSVPMNRDKYANAAKAVITGEKSTSQGNNSFNNVNVSNNNQTIVAPLPSVHNDDFTVRRMQNPF